MAPLSGKNEKSATSVTKSDNVASVLKVFSVLETLSEGGAAPLAHIAQKAMTSKSTTHRLLQTMIDLGYVEQEAETERYGLTLKLFSISARALGGHSQLMKVADRGMRALSRATGESINLGVIDNGAGEGGEQSVVYIHQVESTFSLSMKCTIGSRNPLHCTALGKALLAWSPPDELERRLAELEFTPCGPRTITGLAQFRAELEKARTQGFSEEIEEVEAGVRCMAAPVLDHLGQSIGAISISFPMFRYDETRRSEYIAVLTDAGREASEAMGHRP